MKRLFFILFLTLNCLQLATSQANHSFSTYNYITPLGRFDYWADAQFLNNSATVLDPFVGAAISSGTNNTAIPGADAVIDGLHYGGVFLRSSTTANGGYRYQTSSLINDFFGQNSHKFISVILWRTAFTGRTSTITPTGNLNVMSNHTDNQRVDNLIDDNGNTQTGVDFFIGDNPLTSNFQTEISSSRGVNNSGGFDVLVNRAGMRISTTACPVGFDGLPTGTYTYRVYANEGSGGFTQKEFTATINGVTRTVFIQGNSLATYAEWTGLDETDLASFSLGRNNADIYITATELVKIN